MLPGIHEDTKFYSGRVNPGDKIRYEFPDAEKFVDRSTDDLSVSKDGYFTVNLNAFEFKAGQDIRVYNTHEYLQSQVFDIPVHEAQEDMKEIRVR